jgi:hypothetical protein
VKSFESLPTSFWCLMTKGEEDRLKLEGSTPYFLNSVLFRKTRLFYFAQQNIYLFFLVSISSRLENNVLCENYVLSLVMCI